MSRWIPELTRVDGTIRPYRYFSNHDDKVVALGPSEVEFGTAKQPGAGLFKVISDKLIEMGPTSGKFAALWECTILDESGRACCNRRRINHDKNKTCQTSNLIAHLRERSVTCNFHKAAMKQVDIGSKNCVEVDCNMVKIHNFTEAFPHHVDLLWLRVRGLSISMICGVGGGHFLREFKDEYRGIEGYICEVPT